MKPATTKPHAPRPPSTGGSPRPSSSRSFMLSRLSLCPTSSAAGLLRPLALVLSKASSGGGVEVSSGRRAKVETRESLSVEEEREGPSGRTVARGRAASSISAGRDMLAERAERVCRERELPDRLQGDEVDASGKPRLRLCESKAAALYSKVSAQLAARSSVKPSKAEASRAGRLRQGVRAMQDEL